MNAFTSCLYFGEVVHQRFAPKRHRLRYRVFQGLFDVDELPRLGRELRLFSHNGLNAFAFRDADHGDAAGGTLREYVERTLTQAGLPCDGGKILLLCMPRIFGYVFNPLSIYYCYAAHGALTAMIYEVNNTFGQRHSYVITVKLTDRHGVSQTCAKGFHVSPFMDMNMTYEFKLSLPGATLATAINGNQADGARLIFASFTGVRRELSDATLLTALVTYPLLSLGVVAAIHWEAVKLFAKGVRLRRRPPPPAAAVTLVEIPGSPTHRPIPAACDEHLHKRDKQSA